VSNDSTALDTFITEVIKVKFQVLAMEIAEYGIHQIRS
jgi:hypothetical protein